MAVKDLIQKAQANVKEQQRGLSFGGNYDDIIKVLLQSPAFQQQLSLITGASSRLGTDLLGSIGRAGGQTTGIGALAAPAARSAGSFARGQAFGQASMSAQDLAMQLLLARLGIAANKEQNKGGGLGGFLAGLAGTFLGGPAGGVIAGGLGKAMGL